MRTFIVCTILAFCCLAVSCKGFAYRVPTDSMKPTINVGDICYANPFAYSNKPIERFDIVVFQSAEMSALRNSAKDTRYIKRIIGLPGDKLEIRDNKIYVNDNLIEEPFEKIIDEDDQRKDYPAIIISNNEYFLLGDNRPGSEDSRYWKKTTISREDIMGKVVQIIHRGE